MKRRVALVANWDWVLFNFRLPLARALEKAGFKVTLICPPGKYYKQIEALGFRLIPWHLSRRGINPLNELRAVSHLAKIYRQEGFDLVHHFTIKPILYGSIAGRIAKRRVIINNFTGLGFLFSDDGKAVGLRKILLPLMRLVIGVDDQTLVFQNKTDHSHLVDLGLVPAANPYIIPGTGVDLSGFRQKIYPNSSTTTVFMASRLLLDKGLREFVGAAKRLSLKGEDIQFLVAGDLDEGNPAHISEEQLETWKEAGWVTFLGHRSDVRELLAEADVAVLPSYHEGVPLFLIEAAAAGLPIVASDIPGCALVVKNEVNGFLVPVRDTKSLANAIEMLHHNPSKREEFGKQSRKIAEENFDIHDINQRYVEIYQKLV